MLFHSSLLLAAMLSTVSAQYFNNSTLGSCVDVDCPSIGDGTIDAGCRVTNRTLSLIGLESFSTSITDNQDNLTWTVGTTVYDGNGERIVEKDFYLGTPPSLDLTKDNLPYHGCAIFLYRNELIRPEKFSNESESCDDIIGIECLSSLLTAATAHLTSGSNKTESAEDACERVQRGLNETFPSGCSKVAGQDSWNGIHAVALTGENAPQPPSQSSNESSNCHPTLPKSNSLSFVFGFNDTGTYYADSTLSMLAAVNLVLTLFWSPNNTADSALKVPDSHLSCLWPVDMTKDGAKNMKGSSAVQFTGSSTVALVVVAAALSFFV